MINELSPEQPPIYNYSLLGGLCAPLRLDPIMFSA